MKETNDQRREKKSSNLMNRTVQCHEKKREKPQNDHPIISTEFSSFASSLSVVLVERHLDHSAFPKSSPMN